MQMAASAFDILIESVSDNIGLRWVWTNQRCNRTACIHRMQFKGLTFPTSVWQRKNGIYIRVKTHLVSTMRLLKMPPKFENHFARMIVRFQAQLEVDGCFSAQKSSELAFHYKQNELSCSLFLPRFPLRFLAHCRKWRVFKVFCWHTAIFVVIYPNNLI